MKARRLIPLLFVIPLLSAMGGCATSKLAGPVHGLPHVVVTAMNDNAPPAKARQTSIWVDPAPVPELASLAREKLTRVGYRITDRQDDAEATLRFDGYFWALSADRRKMLTVKLENWADREQRMRFMTGANEPGLASRTFDRVTDAGLSGSITSPGHLLVAATLGLAMEGAASLVGLRGGGGDANDMTADAKPAPLCSSESPCESDELIRRYGVQSVTLGLDWIDRTGKTRLAAKAEGIAPSLIPERLLNEAASVLLARYTQSP